MALKGKIIKLDNSKLAIECLSFHYAEPQQIRHVWEIDRFKFEGLWIGGEQHALGREANLDSGNVSCYLGQGAYLRGWLKDGGSTHAIVVETTPVPCPKVRAGVETRWYRDHWQKFTKRDGWVNL